MNVLVCERRHPLLCTEPSLCVTVGVPQASVAVALPSEAAGFDGLHPNATVV